jgi:hypothetical protein
MAPSSINTTKKRPKIIVPNPESVQKALDRINATLSDPNYQDQLLKLSQLSITHSVQTVQKLSNLSTRINDLDGEEMDKLIRCSLSDLLSLSLSFNTDMLNLIQQTSDQTIAILDTCTPEPKKSPCPKPERKHPCREDD